MDQPDKADVKAGTITVAKVVYLVRRTSEEAHFYEVTRRHDGARFGVFDVSDEGGRFAGGGGSPSGDDGSTYDLIFHMAKLWAEALNRELKLSRSDSRRP